MNTFNQKLQKAAAQRRARVLLLYEKGRTQKQIAEKMGVSRARVWKMISDALVDRENAK